jgi:hypothetical protein
MLLISNVMMKLFSPLNWNNYSKTHKDSDNAIGEYAP